VTNDCDCDCRGSSAGPEEVLEKDVRSTVALTAISRESEAYSEVLLDRLLQDVETKEAD
jgi:hypothetical protein